ncbi:MAG: alcohol dehydrogenase catalytic domain-containing protein [Calditrichaceae bacterium]|nr:alcohol dehydrogenase catalytic domain-containing protein [Calditrichaceae bacterium]MBN2709904.1 alcohol dehydrogenase catalytic domain-containing protein [Calditrichaceae bacterium]RQV92659.1 MAG: hypothetical protein EH224_14855 [Calditrichota bacterium]
MKKVILSSLGHIKIIDAEEPSITAGDHVKLMINWVGICGSDLHYFRTGRIGNQVVKYPFSIGHEATATVVGTGKEVRNLVLGDRVAIEPAISCGKCDQCLAGREHTCRNLTFLGNPSEAEGCMQEFIVVPEKVCFKLPDAISTDYGVLLEPLTIALHSMSFTPFIGDTAILGAGPIGLCVMEAIRLKKHGKIFVTDLIDHRLNVSKLHGANWIGNPGKTDIVKSILAEVPLGLDTVFECCGKQEAINHALHLLKPGGSLVIVGIPEVDHIEFDIHLLRRKEINIYNVRRQNKQFNNAIHLVETKQLDIFHLITHRFDYSDTQQAMDLVDKYQDEIIKALISFN